MSRPLLDELAWTILETMLLIRRFEEAVLRLSRERQFVGHYHLYIGQEATGAAIMSLLDGRDRVATTHRNHGAWRAAKSLRAASTPIGWSTTIRCCGSTGSLQAGARTRSRGWRRSTGECKTFHLLHDVRGGGAPQHSHSPQSMMCNAPGLEIAVPATAADVYSLVRTAFASANPTVIVNHAKLLGIESPVPAGKSRLHSAARTSNVSAATSPSSRTR
jgi:hypothetical protein